MRFAVAPVVLSLALLAAPAFAQTGMNNGTNSGANGENGQYSANENGTYGNQGNTNYGANENRSAENQNWQNRGVSYDTQQRIRQSLAQNGFKDIRIMPQAFVIRAQAPDGQPVVMEVAPDQFAAVVGPNQPSGSSLNNNGNGNSGMNQSGSSANGDWNQNNGANNR
ncbi:MAG TPA: hypothetical protein VME41_18635 [Stellaceae bacterium]|nr:hypothetical protein [Stellaceae bacterium]